MADFVTLNGELSIGPSSVNGDGSFPIGIVSIPLALRPVPKPAAANSGKLTKTLLGGGFVTLPGVGAQGVTKATFLYLRSSVAGEIRLTTDDGAGGSVVATIPVENLVILEFPSTKYLKQLEVNISGLIEYAVTGDS